MIERRTGEHYSERITSVEEFDDLIQGIEADFRPVNKQLGLTSLIYPCNEDVLQAIDPLSGQYLPFVQAFFDGEFTSFLDYLERNGRENVGDVSQEAYRRFQIYAKRGYSRIRSSELVSAGAGFVDSHLQDFAELTFRLPGKVSSLGVLYPHEGVQRYFGSQLRETLPFDLQGLIRMRPGNLSDLHAEELLPFSPILMKIHPGLNGHLGFSSPLVEIFSPPSDITDKLLMERWGGLRLQLNKQDCMVDQQGDCYPDFQLPELVDFVVQEAFGPS